ncbi:CaiB/BaiF CoA transferase family protein [Ramlibacter sp. MAHUQ-53]|uniref:CaiB/BaiF CoA transferase family protein n=1 Tax=unclassified Ramlibacter TaxID=2617605 RepID=UPI0036390A8C
MNALPLAGIRVVDASVVVMGPYASQWLADLGAEVIKVEAPEGDSTRHTGPALEPGMSAIFLGVNRSKRSVAIDLKTPGGQQALATLIASADVFMHSMRPQKLAAVGLDPQALRARHPRLVYAGLHGFAQDGPYGGRPAYDDIIQGMSGSAALMKAQGGVARYLPTIAADKTSGLVAAMSILAALVRRGQTGEGSFVEVPMFETMVAFNLVEHLYGQHFEPPRGTTGYPRVMSEWRRPYQTLDGHVCLMPYTDTHWRRFFEGAGRPDCAADERFASMAARTRNIEALYELTGRIVAERPSAHWLALCDRLEIPAAPVNELADLKDDPHLRATGFFEEMPSAGGTLRFTGVPVRFDGRRPPVGLPPHLGEHTREALAEAGATEDQIAAWLASGAIRQEAPHD